MVPIVAAAAATLVIFCPPVMSTKIFMSGFD
jgi:hypothetical protein